MDPYKISNNQRGEFSWINDFLVRAQARPDQGHIEIKLRLTQIPPGGLFKRSSWQNQISAKELLVNI